MFVNNLSGLKGGADPRPRTGEILIYYKVPIERAEEKQRNEAYEELR